MPRTYVPGNPNPYFPKHKYHGIGVGYNLQPMSECRLHYFVGPAATVERAIGSYQLTPEHLWRTFQQEAEDIIKVNGAFIEDDTERNRRINAAYAKLWLAGNRFQWAGLAAFASKQVGCGLLHARQLSEKHRDELRAVVHWAGSSTEAAGMSAMPTTIRTGADYMHERLGFANMHLFLDIYPLHRFYRERGPQDFETYLTNRQAIGKTVEWKAEKYLKFGFPFGQIRSGFAEIGAGSPAGSVRFWLAMSRRTSCKQSSTTTRGCKRLSPGTSSLGRSDSRPGCTRRSSSPCRRSANRKTAGPPGSRASKARSCGWSRNG